MKLLLRGGFLILPPVGYELITVSNNFFDKKKSLAIIQSSNIIGSFQNLASQKIYRQLKTQSIGSYQDFIRLFIIIMFFFTVLGLSLFSLLLNPALIF